MKKPLVILTGPTAVGKTELSIRLAKKINGEIISADSMQVYRRMDIGTAKIKQEEMQGVSHYLIDLLEPTQEFNVVKFQEYALGAMQEIYAKGKIPIIVGGTGFYIQSVLYGIDFKENEEDSTYRKELEELAQVKGQDFLHDELKKVDENSAKSIHPNNVKRVIRALEYYKQTGLKISEHNEEQRQKESLYNFCYFVLTNEREILYDRINLRIDKMLEAGLLEEVKGLLDSGCTKDMISMQGLGYKEIISYLQGESTLEEAIYLLKRDTRHFAKRQLTWFKREKDVTWIEKNKHEDKDDKILEVLCEHLRLKDII
ncbi:MAG: tRNA (adenosine(37)-N6)-dimethylallyltransferase MiaA [Anaerocolumna sp.]